MMKKLGLLILFTVFFNVTINSQPIEQLMQEGNQFYINEQWQDAVESYNKILYQGYESAALYHNLGNSFFRLGNLGEAILNYERALKLEPRDEDIRFNLRLANARTIDNIKEVPQIFIVDWWNNFVSVFTVSGWAFIFLLVYLLMLAFIGIYFLSQNINLQRFSIYGGIASLIILFITLLIFISAYDREASTDYGIILVNSVNVKASPTPESSDSFIIHEGLKFEIQDQLDDWVRIKLADGKVGWLPGNTFGKI